MLTNEEAISPLCKSHCVHALRQSELFIIYKVRLLQWNRLISSRDLRDAVRGLICFYLERTPLVVLLPADIETHMTCKIVHCTRTCGNCCTELECSTHYSLSLSRPEIRPHSFAPNRRERNFKSDQRDECHRSHYCKYTSCVFAAQWRYAFLIRSAAIWREKRERDPLEGSRAIWTPTEREVKGRKGLAAHYLYLGLWSINATYRALEEMSEIVRK